MVYLVYLRKRISVCSSTGQTLGPATQREKAGCVKGRKGKGGCSDNPFLTFASQISRKRHKTRSAAVAFIKEDILLYTV